jgi:membrane fusion protein, multidrug efflux system
MNKIEPPQPTYSPDATRSSKSSTWKWIVALIFLVGAGATYYFFPPKQSAAPVGPGGFGGKGGGFGGRGGRGGVTPVSITQVSKGDLKVYLSALGTVNALNTATVKANANGELLKIYFTEGQLVKAGDLLAEIDSRQYRISLEQAEAQLARDTAVLANHRRDLERYQGAGASITQQQIDTEKATVAQFEGTVRADQATVENAKLQLSYCRVTAPISGRIGLRMVDQGNIIRANDPGIAVITQEQPISVVFSIPEDNLPQIRKALSEGKKLEAEAYDRGMKTRLATGTLVAVDNQIDATTGTVRLKASFPNEDGALFPNQFVNVRMLTEVLEGVAMIPNSAIQLNGPARFVFVVSTDETVERRTITVGRTEGENTVVTDGLIVGETVVTEGVDRLQSGSRVMARTPIPEAPAGGARGKGKGGKAGKGTGTGERGKQVPQPKT